MCYVQRAVFEVNVADDGYVRSALDAFRTEHVAFGLPLPQRGRGLG
jgi:hypothetical protein